MFSFQLVILIVLLLVMYGIYRTLMKSESKGSRILANLAGGAFAVLTCVLVLFLRPLVLDSAVITSDSMVPTLQVGEHLFSDRLTYKRRDPHYGEIVTFALPSREAGAPEDILVKRLIGLPGDTILVKDGAVYRNNQRLNEPYIREPIQYAFSAVKVPPGKLFVLGDNRNVSDDSHIWGFLDRSRLIGRVTIRFWPLSRMGSPE
jgi:signal peptidase I